MSNVSNEEIVSALISNGTISDAATACGLSQRAIYDRMKEADFKDLYNEAKNDILRHTISGVSNHAMKAINIVAEIMENEEVNPATRLQAAQTILNNLAKFTERLNEAEKVTDEINDNVYVPL